MPSSSLSGHYHPRLLLLALVASLSTLATCKDNPFTWVDCQTSPASSPALAPSASSTVNTTFRSNLVALLDALPSAAAPTGFASLSRGVGAGRAFVRGICRGDSSPDDCASYLRTAVAGITSRCNDSILRAGIWYDKCFVAYAADTGSASTKHEQEFRSILVNVGKVADKDAFEAAYYALMSRLSARVVNVNSSSGTAPMFATGQAVYDGNAPNGTMHGLLQCMRDRTAAECDRCLRDSVPKLPKCCYGNQGGVVLGYNCYLRVEIYTYYDLALDAAPPPPPPAPAPANSPSLVVGEKQGKKRTSTLAAVALAIGTLIFVAVTICVSVVLLYSRRNANQKKTRQDKGREVEDNGYIAPEQLNLTVLRAATNNFSMANKLGQGGFGEVFKGTLQDGEEIAVKRLSRRSSQGFSELKNELVLAATLKHKNLVHIIGVCLQDEHKLVIYEYLPNRSLDTFLFDPVRRQQLDWSKRFTIICGIARGLLYLHEESRLKVIHRDLKPSNVLLDAEMNPKISDFGLARAFSGDQSSDITRKPAGTLGYMSPEYAYYGRVSTKSDMFSFGVIVLEIVTGKKSTDECEDSLSLLSYIWGKWRTGSPADVVDLSLAGQYPEEEVLNCLEVGLLCIQENPADRPDASAVVLMLSSHSTVDDGRCPPSRPAFVFRSVRGGPMPDGAFRTEGAQLIGEEQTSTALISTNDVTVSELLPR